MKIGSLITRTLRPLVAGIALAACGVASAQFPSKPITIIVPAAPGGILDQMSRLIASELPKLVGQPVLVENKAGANQIIGVQAAARAEPDGHTLVMGSIGLVVADVTRLPYAPGDFAPIAHVVSMPNVLLVHPAVPARNVAELVAIAKSRPTSLTLGSSGTATSGHLAAELLEARAGIDLLHVPYKGSTPAMTDLIGGQVQVMVDNLITALPQVKAGKVRALAVTSAQRVAEMPDVPTVAESGYPGFEVTVWIGLLAPAKTPDAVVATLHGEISKVLALPHVKKRMADIGGSTMPLSPAQFGEFIRGEIDKWATVIRQANIKAE